MKFLPVRVPITAVLLCSLLALGGCASLNVDSCADIGNMTDEERRANQCDGSPFSASNLRATTYRGDDSAVLWTGSPERLQRDINPTALNAPPSAKAPIIGYVGALRVEVPVNPDGVARDLADIRQAGAPTFDPNERVRVNFNEASLNYFLKQLLEGALGVTYIAPPNIGGSITFRIENPIPKGQVIQVVRDVLARNGLEMVFMNGVYHIGGLEEMAALRAVSASGRQSDQVTRFIRLKKGDAAEIIAFVQQLTPNNVTLTATGNGSSIIVRAAPTAIDEVAELIQVADDGVGDDRVAIIPLRESSPNKLAIKLNEFYRSQLGENSGVTVMPLENQQAILVGTQDARVMEGVKRLTVQLDRDTGSDFSLRVIPLTYLGAEEIVPQLNEIFGGGNTTAAENGGDDSGNGGNDEDNGFDAARVALQDNSNANATDQGNGGFSRKSGSRGSQSPSGGGGGAQTIKIVSDKRNNTVMVYSSYSLFKRMKQLLGTLDVPQAQLVLEATVAEVTLNDALERGVEAFLTQNNVLDQTGSPLLGPAHVQAGSTATQGGFIEGRFGIGSVTVDVILKALQEVTTVKVVSSPYLTVRDGKTARLVIGNQIPFTRSTQTANPDSANVTVVEQIETKDTGVILEVTPRIRQDNSTILTINQAVSTVNEERDTGTLTPTINTREVKSEVIAKSGATILLGGLIKDSVNRTESGIPVLKDIALVGDLFKTTKDTGRREELIVLITPRVIRNSAQIENITRQLRGMMNIR